MSEIDLQKKQLKLEKLNDKEYLLTFNQNQILKGTIE